MRHNDAHRLTTLTIVSLAIALSWPGQVRAENDDLFFKDRLQPVTEANIFKTEGHYNWCSSVIKGPDGQYHLFYSRWKKAYKFN